MASEGQVQRTILRLVQNHPDGIQRTLLSVQARPHSADWDDVLRDLIARGLIVEGSEVRRSKKNHRAIIVYRLNPDFVADHNPPRFEDMNKEDVQAFVEGFPAADTAVA
jgi:hypothetical protein